jgi:phosphosulfolactate synthase
VQDFLDIVPRAGKPREQGLTQILDRGSTVAEIDGLFELAGDYIDLVKLGWGTSYVTSGLESKLELYRRLDVPVVVGGTLSEIAIAQDRLDQYRGWLHDHGLTHVEVSNGTIPIPKERKLEIVEMLAREFTVLVEVGEKDPHALVAPYRWVTEIEESLEAGAWRVVTEARESGTAGVFRPSGELREGLIEEIVARIEPAKLLFEAPLKEHQVWFIERFGRDVNLGNVAPNDVIPLETLRLGLRADTAAKLLFGE